MSALCNRVGHKLVSGTDVGCLEQDPSKNTKSWDAYNSSILSTFGSLNTWKPCPGSAIVTQNFATLAAVTCTRAADIDASGVINVNDLLAVINSWGVCTGLPCAGDVDNNGVVNVNDLLTVINNWG